MMLQYFRLGFVPFSDLFGGFAANLYTSTAIILDIPSYGGKFVDGGLWNVGTDAKSVDLDVKDIDDPVEWQLWSLGDLIDSGSTVHAGDLPFPCACDGCGAPGSYRIPKQRRIQSSRSFRRLVARNEQLLTFGVVVAVLQLFLHVTRATATPLLLPAAAQAALALVNAAGVLGSAVATRRYGREATCAVSAALIVLCQIGVPALVGAHAGGALGGGARSTTACHGAAMLAVSCGLGWAWGALFWASPGPGEGIRSAGPAALCFAQMHCSLLTLRRLRHAALAYYAARIWS